MFLSLYIDSNKLNEDPSYQYDGLVYLKNGDPNKRYSGTAKMIIQGQELWLCNISTTAAESICRQLGYTGTLGIKIEQK